MGNFFGKALIIDNNAKFLEEIKQETSLLVDYPCILSKSFIDAMKILKQEKHNIRVVFLSNSIGSTFGFDELKMIRVDRPTIPVLLITHVRDAEALNSDESEFLKVINSPKNYTALTKEMDELFCSKD